MKQPIELPGLLNGGWEQLTFQPFSDGVEIYPILEGEPAVALLRYQPGASVRRHRHTGLETICVLAGSQSDDHGTYETGSIIVNPEGSSHAVWSKNGCIVLIQWTKPVEFLD